MPIQRLLVANRGEIALRVFRTCRALGVETVAVAAPDDTASLHARSADATVEISNYLHSEEHIRAARETGADSIHPGYGFLAENADFAEAVEAAGLTWIGPPPAALRLGGTRSPRSGSLATQECRCFPTARPRMSGSRFSSRPPPEAAGGGCVSSARPRSSTRRWRRRARGRRRVRRRDALLRAVPRASSPRRGAAPRGRARKRGGARRARLLGAATPPEGPRGSPGSARRCGAPRPPARGRCRLRACHRIPKRWDSRVRRRGNAFFFLELNGRIQVEHPVTEAVTGLDLVERQIRIAEGETLGDPRAPNGHAVEVRLYAEDPRTFLPQAGRIERLRLPTSRACGLGRRGGRRDRPRLRPDDREARRAGPTRGGGARSPRAALAETEVAGVTTNLAFLRWLVAPGGPGGRRDHGVLDRLPPAHGTTTPPPRGAVPRALAPEPSAPPPAPPPDLDVESHRPRPGGREPRSRRRCPEP